jgi:putative transcriptional regulator
MLLIAHRACLRPAVLLPALKLKAMTSAADTINLTHHFLIAMPGLVDSTFSKSVIYMCEHSGRGALGLVINKPSDISLKKLFDKVELPLSRADLAEAPVFHGGPVQTERGFVLHESMMPGDESVYASTMTIPGGLEMTTSKDVLEALASGAGPRKIFVSLGYSSWSQGQLESEISDNSWLTVAADPALIFDTPVDQRYDKALLLLGLQAWMISPEAGHS